MSNGYNRLLCGSVGSSLVSPTLTFRTTCCQIEVSISHIVRLERYRIADSKCCCVSEAENVPGAPSLRNAPEGSLRTAQSAPSRWFPGSYRASDRGLRRNLSIGKHPFHTHSGSSFKNSTRECGPIPTLPKKPPPLSQPATPLLTHPILPKRTNLPYPPYVSVGPLSADGTRTAKGAGPDISLPNSPVQERELEKERQRREAARQLELARQKEEKSRREQELLDARAEERKVQKQAAERAREEVIVRKREEWMLRFRRVQDIAKHTEVFPLGNKASIDRYLQRYRLLERAKHLESQLTEWYSDGGLNEQTRGIGNSIYFDTRDALSDENLAPILKELNDTDRYWAYLRNPDIVKDEKPGTSLPTRIRLRLYGILWLRYHIIDTAYVISMTLHDLRQIRRLKAQVLCSAEIYGHLKLIYPLQLLVNAITLNAERIMTDYFHLRHMSGLYYAPSSQRLTTLFYESAFLFHGAKVRWLSRIAIRDVRQKLEGLARTAVQRDLFSNLRPLIAHNRDFVGLQNSYANLLTLFKIPSRSPPTRLMTKIEEAHDHLSDTQRDILLLTEFVMLWSGVRKICLGSPSGNGDRHVPSPNVDSSLATSSVPRYNTEQLAPAVTHVVPWQTPTSLYPLGTAIPIHYVITYSGLRMVLPRFSSCKVLGFDTIHTAKTQGNRLVEFLILASDHEVAIIHIALMNQLTLISKEPFVDIMQNASILKVGVDVESQGQLLADGPSIELEGAVELCDSLSCDVPPSATSSKDRPGSIISSMAAQVFGSPLPAVDLPRALRDLLLGTEFRAIRRVGSIEPLHLLTHLASRAYAALRLYRAAADGKFKPTSSSLVHSNVDEPSFGPVLVYRQSGLNDDGLPRQRWLPRQRLLHLASIAEHWATAIFWARVHTKDFKKLSRREQKVKREKAIRKLTAYCLFTTFNERLDTIQRYMGMRLVATEILAISDDAKLPLRPRDVELLDFWRKWKHEENVPQSEVQENVEPGVKAAAHAHGHKINAASPIWESRSEALHHIRRPQTRTVVSDGTHTAVAKQKAADTVQHLPRSTHGVHRPPHDLTVRPSQKKFRASSTISKRMSPGTRNAEQSLAPSKPVQSVIVPPKPRLRCANLSAPLKPQIPNFGQGMPMGERWKQQTQRGAGKGNDRS
ncbi:uncharacterized protein PV07_07307 [Cladophialophora immunda]|uniref:Uncharacterized protein n=1 Tax=Cladophialophora immunda TaxID=569365 RepID=A0A0D2C903_9EURO|nr:uncharacterized protein PV07_07307 [Cladophialophora immunda]KIW27578.1 hypothetical protein PV07_07307 [Cladophialophora immunda]